MLIIYHSSIHSKHFLGYQLCTSQDIKNKDIRDQDIHASRSRANMWREKRENK